MSRVPHQVSFQTIASLAVFRKERSSALHLLRSEVKSNPRTGEGHRPLPCQHDEDKMDILLVSMVTTSGVETKLYPILSSFIGVLVVVVVVVVALSMRCGAGRHAGTRARSQAGTQPGRHAGTQACRHAGAQARSQAGANLPKP